MANKFESFMKKLGEDVVKVFNIAEKIAVAEEPYISKAFPVIGTAYTAIVEAVKSITDAGKAAITAGASDLDNLAAVTAAITPLMQNFAKATGATQPTLTQIMNAASALIAGVKAA